MDNKYYILHYAIMDTDGSLCIDCKVYANMKEAKREQMRLLEEFKMKYDVYKNEVVEEEIGLFKRVAYENELMEMQSHVVSVNDAEC